jgi:hypothetical protein
MMIKNDHLCMMKAVMALTVTGDARDLPLRKGSASKAVTALSVTGDARDLPLRKLRKR